MGFFIVKIHVDKNHLLKQLISAVITFSIAVGVAVIFFNDVYTHYYVEEPARALIVVVALPFWFLVFAFARGAIRFSAGNTKDD